MDIRSFFIKWAGFLRSELTWEPEENISPKPLIENYFNERSDNETPYDASVCANVKFGRQNDLN